MLPGFFELTNFPGGFQTVHLGHHDVHENQIVTTGLERGHRLQPIPLPLDLMALPLQPEHREVGVGFDVLNQ